MEHPNPQARPDDGPDFTQGEVVSVVTTEGFDRLLDYRAPEGGLRLGDYVEAPLASRKIIAVVWGAGQGDVAPEKLRSITRRLDSPPMRPAMRTFLTRASDYTLASLSAMARLATRAPGFGDPPGARPVLRLGDVAPDRQTAARQRVIEAFEEYGNLGFAPGELARLAGVSASVVKGLEAMGVVLRTNLLRDDPFPELQADANARPLSTDQADAAASLSKLVSVRAYSATLLQGVTGSGKTEVYLEAVAETLRSGRQALVLLPEIALSAEFLDRVEARFGARPVEWHSGVTRTVRRRAWRAIARGEAQLVVGARSALFLPFEDLGLIVVDEEHDKSYKQEDGVIYNARDMAVLRASIEEASIVLASATPSLETWTNAEAGKYQRIVLRERFGAARLPEMGVVDLRTDAAETGRWISQPLVEAVSARLALGEQSLLFLNRRGYAPLTICRACGLQVACDQCDARMVEHRLRRRLVCHQCGATAPVPRKCPSCGAEDKLAAVGPGVERLAEEAEALWPEARVSVLSSDFAEGPRALKARIDEIASGGADIVVGTQLVSKGYNFPLLTLVGVIDADIGLQGGDLRASERTFQLVRQVAGRAGRAERPGLALIQTYQPEHPALRAIISGDEEAFWSAEADARRRAGAPPFGRMAGIVVSGQDERRTWDAARALATHSGPLAAIGADLYGPAPAAISRIRGRHRVRLLAKASREAPLQAALRDWRAAVDLPSGVRVSIDIDPQSFV